MTTLQEALGTIASALPAYIDCVPSREYLAVVHAALAQQGEPVAWYDEEIDCAYTATELDGGTSDGLIPLYTAAPAPHPAQTKQVLENLEQVKAT